MAFICVEDKGGDAMELVDIDGYRIATADSLQNTVKMFKNIPNIPCREDDIFICAAMKSGTHWVWETVSMLCNGNSKTIPKSKLGNMLESTQADNRDKLHSPRVFNTHLHYKYLPTEMKEKKCKIIFILRNPKDVAVSHYSHVTGLTPYNYNGEWKNFLQLFLEGKLEYLSWFDYVKEWEELIMNDPDLPVHVIYYEDLIENNIDEIYRLGKYLGIENKENLYKRISEKCHIERMKNDKIYSTELASIIKGDFSFFRKGEIGDWKNHFTVAQSELFDKIYAKKMENSKLRFRFITKN